MNNSSIKQSSIQSYSNNLLITNIYNSNAINILSDSISQNIKSTPIIICIGSDKLLTDSLGPLVGTILSSYLTKDYNIFGTLESPITALNIENIIHNIKNNYPFNTILAIDASLTNNTMDLYNIYFKKSPIYPGKGLNKKLPPIGDFSISVNVDTHTNIFHANTRLYDIYTSANIIAQSIINSLKKENN